MVLAVDLSSNSYSRERNIEQKKGMLLMKSVLNKCHFSTSETVQLHEHGTYHELYAVRHGFAVYSHLMINCWSEERFRFFLQEKELLNLFCVVPSLFSRCFATVRQNLGCRMV